VRVKKYKNDDGGWKMEDGEGRETKGADGLDGGGRGLRRVIRMSDSLPRKRGVPKARRMRASLAGKAT